uniref:hypothetical protein n=1 Tax=Agathobacter sp. TaxID=2021311 RepID=UPI00405735BE
MNLDEKKLKTGLFIICFYIYFKFFWWCYDEIVLRVSVSSIELLTIWDMAVLLVYIITCVPCTLGIRHLVLKFLSE